MSVDRYLAITQSLRQPWMPSRRGACSLLVALWLVSLAIFAPLLAVAAVETVMVPMLSRTRNGSSLTRPHIDPDLGKRYGYDEPTLCSPQRGEEIDEAWFGEVRADHHGPYLYKITGHPDHFQTKEVYIPQVG
ncbi:unnamed protein product [Euphydryas editha]|uniref:G-protein coupled receptors family 1 profile domain-containing protein n=1 Tax=Euphydryas editha TaxID=104508 RepID=A0AAU9VC38_EUPED|nr:unnamed protein product [Euphydryas editha]